MSETHLPDDEDLMSMQPSTTSLDTDHTATIPAAGVTLPTTTAGFRFVPRNQSINTSYMNNGLASPNPIPHSDSYTQANIDRRKLFVFEDKEQNGAIWSHHGQLQRRGRGRHRSGMLNGGTASSRHPESASQSNRLQSTPGAAGFLEIEEEPPRHNMDNSTPHEVEDQKDEDLLGLSYEPVQTSSGLLLTHRRTPPVARRPQDKPSFARESDDDKRQGQTFLRVPGVRVSAANNASFEMDTGYDNRGTQEWRNTASTYVPGGHSLGLTKATRILSFVRLWVVVFCAVLLIGTGVAIHSMRHEGSELGRNNEKKQNTVQDSDGSGTQITENGESLYDGEEIVNQVILLPLNDVSQLRSSPTEIQRDEEPHRHGVRRVLHDLREEFEEWMNEHNKLYRSEEEKETRFSIWSDNHYRTIEKNKSHGPCKLTKQPVFGSNQFKDLTNEEFQSQFLTGYKGPKTDDLESHLLRNKEGGRNQPVTPRTLGDQRPMRRTSKGSGLVMGADDPLSAVDRHPSIQKQFLAHWNPLNLEGTFDADPTFKANYSSCRWYDISCWLRWFFNTYGFGIGGVMTPDYDSDSYPSAVDWREMGVVTDVHSQGNCGACWAITAVETIESAYAMKTGTLMDLAETEVILCDSSCEMCEGGWPQNAYEYTMEHNGLPAENDIYYDGDLLLAITMVLAGESDELDSDYIQSYMYDTCPNGGGSHSGDGGNNSYQRYASIGGYGYATERCICYTDGSGCDCDDQNERMAVRNLATYGPATVCLDASVWQDYAGGIITSSSGCGSQFLDMNHCVQAVGYAFVDLDEEEGDGQQQQGSNSHSGSNSGSQDSANREGYWIIRNQWSNGWGINGYAYVAMGENTCGVLNDMTQAYM